MTSVPSDANSPYQPSVSPVSATRRAWWKSSAQAASQPQPPAPEALRELLHAAELLVVAGAVAREQDPQGVVEVVGPLAVVAEAAPARGPGDLRIVQAALGDHERPVAARVQALGERLQHVLRARIEDRVDRVEQT